MNDRHRMEQELSDLGVARADRRPSDYEVLHTPDQRARVNNAEAVPYRWICHLAMKARDTTNPRATASSTATGVLIGPRHVLTTGHTLLAQVGRFEATHAWVTPGLNGANRPFGRAESTNFRTHPQWFSRGAEDNDFDYGIITLDDAIGDRRFRSLGNAPLGWWGDPVNGGGTRLERLDPASLDGVTINVAGYPNDKPAGTLWTSHGQASPLRDGQGNITTARRLPHNADTHSSQSGSPVWRRDTEKGIRYLVGIHEGAVDLRVTAATGTQKRRTNVAIRVTRELLRQIAAWK